jgi:2-polyprenyl-3-methyl-5-hydroxy-6-metoxy-1,4-benzoquinol methylase
MPGSPTHTPGSSRAEREILHGRHLAALETESVWGWGTPAGQLRACRRAQLIMEGAGLSPGQRALEIGCGTGLFTEMFADRGAQIVAVDISSELLAKARARNLPPDQVIFLEKRFEDCEVDGPFDAVIGSSILHHLDIGEALVNIRRLLKPGGILSFAEPNLLNPQVYLERKFHHLPMFSYTSPDETAFVRWKFARVLREHGFCEVSITPYDWVHPAVPRPLIGPVRALGSLLERLPLIREFSGSLYIRAQNG